MSEPATPVRAATGEEHPREAILRTCVSRISEGSEDALATLYDNTSSFVYGIALRVLGHPPDAEEVTLDVYSQIWRSASGFESQRGTVLGWLTSIARSRAIDRLRSRRSKSQQHEVEIVSEQVSPAPSPEDATAAGEQRERVRAALAALPDAQRQLIELACFSGYTHSELALRTGLPLGTIKTRLRLGLSRLRELLAADGELTR
jgi:RNA polymerase sigma-70 factor, ECF subfamily